jgi:hypothetical protein
MALTVADLAADPELIKKAKTEFLKNK